MRGWTKAAALLVALAGPSACIDTASVACQGGFICPADTVCDDVHKRCVLPEQIAACLEAEAGTEPDCSFPGVDDGACLDGVCFELECGNELIQRDEICDDGNQGALDGCSADCRSLEECGDGVADPLFGETCDDENAISHDGCHSACELELPVWRELPVTPLARANFSMVYDSRRAQVVLFGGFSIDEGRRLDDTWLWDGASWRAAGQASSSPAPRTAAAMAYHAARDRTILFGGDVGNATNDTWEWDGARWTLLTLDSSPPARFNASMTYDSGRGRIVLYGGRSGSGTLHLDTWELYEIDGELTWTELQPSSSPGRREQASMAYDPRRGRTVLVGGKNGPSDTWEWDGGDWSRVVTTMAPEALSDASMAYDVSLGKVVLFGGLKALPGNFLDQTWAFDGLDWEQLSPSAMPAARVRAAAAYDVARRQMVLFGGRLSPLVGAGDTWLWTGSDWLEEETAAPPSRERHAMAYDPSRGTVVLFGGQDGPAPGGIFADTWLWRGRWIAGPGSGPSARRRHAMCADASGDGVVVFAGLSSADQVLNDTWHWDGISWTERQPSLSPPARVGHAMTRASAQGRVVLYGGTADDGGLLGDTWLWDGSAWTSASAASSPGPRSFHKMAYDAVRDEVVLFGGKNAQDDFLGDTWVWDGATWEQRFPSTAPLPRDGAVMFYDAARQRVVLHGGDSGDVERFVDVWEWDGAEWTLLVPSVASPESRREHAMVYDAARGGGLLFGGFAGSETTTVDDDTWSFRHESSRTDEACLFGFDADGDGAAGIDDPDCWAYFSPHCPPGTSCDATRPRCGDGQCNAYLEACGSCAGDCGPCELCGDFSCDGAETASSCPGDCL